MKRFTNSQSHADRVSQEAASWVLQRDRRLTPEEEQEFARWLASDSTHAKELALQQRTWDRLGQLGARADVSEVSSTPVLARGWFKAAAALLGVAAVLVVVLSLRRAPHTEEQMDPMTTRPIEQRTLADGSTIKLNRGAQITTEFTPTERRVILERGEAIFEVAKDLARPFVVSAGNVHVTAIGTAFAVNRQTDKVSVLVAEGHVSLRVPNATRHAAPAAEADPVLTAQQRAIISLGAARVSTQIDTLSVHEVETMLAWQPILFDFTEALLTEVVTAFNGRNSVQLIIADRELALLRLSASLRSDNLEGFVRLLESSFHVRAERRGAREIALTRKP